MRADKSGAELAGTYPDDFMVMLEFPDADAARGWYGSEAYQALIPVREQAADMTFVVLERQ